VLRRDREDEVVGGSNVCQDEGRVVDVGISDDLVGLLECAVCGLFAVVGCGCEAEDDQPVRHRVRLWEDRLLPGLLLAPDLRELPRLLLCYLCVGRRWGWGGLGGGGWLRVLLSGCQYSSGGCRAAVWMGRGAKEATCLVSLSTVLVRRRICFCVSSSQVLRSWRPGILTVVDWLAS